MLQATEEDGEMAAASVLFQNTFVLTSISRDCVPSIARNALQGLQPSCIRTHSQIDTDLKSSPVMKSEWQLELGVCRVVSEYGLVPVLSRETKASLTIIAGEPI